MAAAAVGDEVELEVGQLQPRDGQRRRKVGDLGGHGGGGGGHLTWLFGVIYDVQKMFHIRILILLTFCLRTLAGFEI